MITPAVVVIVSIFSLGEATSWPDGTYCLPMPSNGQCPRGWARGERRHDTEDDNCSSYCSKKQHGWVPYHSDLCRNLGWGFCCKTSNGTTGNTWPRGSYCIFRKGGYCPTGFASGYLHWDDEDYINANKFSGVLPDGTYDRNTDIHFCCRDDPKISMFNSKANYLSGLPKCAELIVMRHNGSCPARASGYLGPHTGYLQWDTEDSRNADRRVGAFPDGEKDFGSGIKIEFCSYTNRAYSC